MYLTHEAFFGGPGSSFSFWLKLLKKTSVLPKGGLCDRITRGSTSEDSDRMRQIDESGERTI
jgi:hypothetical protein